jgi:hypothetical protein
MKGTYARLAAGRQESKVADMEMMHMKFGRNRRYFALSGETTKIEANV